MPISKFYGRGQVVDEFGNTHPMAGDNMFRGAPIVISHSHHEIHCGDSYVSTYIKDVPIDGTLDILVVVPNELPPYPDQDQRLYHVEAILLAEAECELSIFEAPTVSANGTAMLVVNRNRNSEETSDLGVFHTPTVTSEGNFLEAVHLGSKNQEGGGDKADEFVLRNDTLYLYRVTSFAPSTNQITIKLNHYIHPGI